MRNKQKINKERIKNKTKIMVVITWPKQIWADLMSSLSKWESDLILPFWNLRADINISN